jgi:lipase
VTILHFHDLGERSGPPVLAVHGITAHGLRFRRLAEQAWPQRRTIAVDLRGHGRSTSHAPWSIDQHVRDLLDTLDSLSIDRIDVVGHSYGGAIALALLHAAPDRVRSLALLDPALCQTGEWATEAALESIAEPGWESIDAATLARNQGLGDTIHPAVVEDIGQHLVQSGDGRYRFRYHLPTVVTGWGEMARPLPGSVEPRPALLVVADHAQLVTHRTEQGLVALFDGQLTVEHLPCGHMLYWERFDDTADAILRFWATVADPGSAGVGATDGPSTVAHTGS